MKNKYFDYKMGLAGALGMGAIVYYINSEYGIDQASIAATKQAVYTFFIGGAAMGVCENLATNLKNKKLARAASTIIPSLATIGLTYLLHETKGTPEPFNSTIPTILLAPPSFIIWGNRKRNQLEKIIEKLN